MKKKFLALILSTALCMTAFPVTGMAAVYDSGAAEVAMEEKADVPETENQTAASTSVPENVNVVWLANGFRWLSRTSALITLRADADGTCYFKWVERNSDGTSTTPKMDTGVSHMTVKKNISFVINLNDLDTDNGVDLYLKILSTDGRTTGLKRLKLNEDTRPKTSATPTPVHIPQIPKVTESTVKGLEAPLKFYANKFYRFTVIGAGTTNNTPGEGDVKWEPLYWSMKENPAEKYKHYTWQIGVTKEISRVETYNMYIFFRKLVYKDAQWQETDTIESACYQLRSASLSKVDLSTPGLTGISNSSSGIVLKWKRVSGAEGYKIYRKTGNSSKWGLVATVKGSGTLTYIDGSAKAGTVYTYTVRAYNGSDLSDYNKTGKRIARLTAPVQYAPSSKAAGKLTLRWKKASAASGYQIQYSASRNFTRAKTVTVSSLSRTFSGLRKGTTYYARIRAYKKSGSSRYYSTWSTVKSIRIKK